MKKDRLLNPAIISEIAAIGHTEYFVIADAGLPVPKGVNRVDISLVWGVPSFMQALEAIAEELVVESYICASELPQTNPLLNDDISGVLKGLPVQYVPHTQFKELARAAKVVIRTGETSAFANIILVAGVNF